MLRGKWLQCLYGVHPAVKDSLHIIGVQCRTPSVIDGVGRRSAGISHPDGADIIPASIRLRGKDNVREVFRQQRVAIFTIAGGSLQSLDLGEVDDYAQEALT